MSTNKMLVVTLHESDLLSVFKAANSEVVVIKPDELSGQNLADYASIALLGGGSDTPMLLLPKDRRALEEQISNGKRVFAEYVASIGDVYFELPISTRYDRLVYCSDDEDIPNLTRGTLIDDQCGMRIKPHDVACVKHTPILQYINVNAHDHIEINDDVLSDVGNRALWFENPDNLLVCSFRLSGFKGARFAPWNEVKEVVSFIVQWLTEDAVDLTDLNAAYSTGHYLAEKPLKEQVEKSIDKAMNWFDDANVVLDDGKSGALEGLGTEVYSNGHQRISQILRADCIGEIALPYYLDYLLTGNAESMKRSDNLLDFVFENYVCREQGALFGMMRWTNEAWGICYQDDVARAILPQLLKCHFSDTRDHLDDCVNALRFLVKTTGTDGTREFRTDNIVLDEAEFKRLRETPGNLPSAHYNAYYYAALLLTYKLTGIGEFKEVAIKGLTTIMELYPNTRREQSETQEYCRLILPLSWLYWVTKAEIHKAWLYQVTDDLEKMAHESGGYIEWDTGYQASMRNEKGEEESSLITENGDPVADLLYSNNWLPVAFMQAYLITGDDKFNKLWERNVKFFINTQIKSDNKQINGTWARAYDVDRKEVYGSPADMGWGPWAIESGWSIAEVTAGLYMGLLKEELKKHYVS